jgi:hypothetical protein
MGFCQQYSVHQGGAGIAYRLAPVEGTFSDIIPTLLWRGLIVGMAPSRLQMLSWALESGLSYDQLPKPYQQDIDVLLPDLKERLYKNNWLQAPRSAYGRIVSNPTKSIGTLGSILGNRSVPVPPSYNDLLSRLGSFGRFVLDAEALQDRFLASYRSEELREQEVFAGQGSPITGAMRAEDTPWTVKVPGVAYMRVLIHGGNISDNNVLEIRILSPQPNESAAGNATVRLMAASFQSTSTGAAKLLTPTLLGLLGVVIDRAALVRSLALVGEVAVAAESAPALLLLLAAGAQAKTKIEEVFGKKSKYGDIPGLCKAATLKEIKAQGWSLNPGRYVGVAPGEDVSDEDFKEQFEELSEELETLNLQAHELEQAIANNVAEILET